MQLLLSSSALVDANLETLRDGAERRGLYGLEVVVATGQGHGIEAACEMTDRVPQPTSSESLTQFVRWLLVAEEVTLAEALYWGRRAHLFEAGLILTEPIAESPAGLPVAVRHSTNGEAARAAATWARQRNAHTCWEVALGSSNAAEIPNVLEVTGPHLAHVRLLGAGPESPSKSSGTVGVGDVLRALALEGYSGTVALGPSGDGRREAWRRWLFEERGWGCNTAANKRASSSMAAA